MVVDDVKKILEEEREQLIGEIEYYKKEDPYLSPDRNSSNTLDDDITEIEGHDRITATRLNLKQRLAEVVSALDRIESGKFGICKNCGEKISIERIQVIPTASLCIECNRKLG